MTTIAARRIATFVAEATALGCKVVDEVKPNGERVVSVTGAHWADRDHVFVTYTPASAKEGKGRRDSLFCMVFSDVRYPRKGSAVVEYHQAVSVVVASLKDYSAHTHCEFGHHYCADATCVAPHGNGMCNVPEGLHRSLGLNHPFTTETA